MECIQVHFPFFNKERHNRVSYLRYNARMSKDNKTCVVDGCHDFFEREVWTDVSVNEVMDRITDDIKIKRQKLDSNF